MGTQTERIVSRALAAPPLLAMKQWTLTQTCSFLTIDIVHSCSFLTIDTIHSCVRSRPYGFLEQGVVEKTISLERRRRWLSSTLVSTCFCVSGLLECQDLPSDLYTASDIQSSHNAAQLTRCDWSVMKFPVPSGLVWTPVLFV